MFRSYFKILFRNLLRSKSHSFINIAGLSIGLASSILIITFIWHELSYDNFHPNIENTYRVYCDQPWNSYMASTKFNVMPIPFQSEIKQRFPEVNYATRLTNTRGLIHVDGGQYYQEHLMTVDQDFLEMFSMPLIYGRKDEALTEPYSVLLSESISEKYFGSVNPVGMVLSMNDTTALVVQAVFKDMPENSHLKFNMMLSFPTYELQRSEARLKSWGNHNVRTYIQLRNGTDPNDFEAKLEELIIDKRGDEIEDRYYIQPVRDIHLYGKLNFEISANGDIKYVLIFAAVALFLILIAAFNYMNLSTARSLQRAKEIGIRKVIGANRKQLFRQFIGEAVFYTLISFLVALMLIELFRPAFNGFVNREIDFYALSSQFYLIVGVLVVFIAVISGSYPAIYLSRFSPAKVLKGNTKGSKHSVRVRNVMVVMQFFISIVLVICTMVIIQQLAFIKNRDLGFATENLLTFKMHSSDWLTGGEAIQNELEMYPEIIGVSSSQFLPSRILSSSSLSFSTDDGQKSIQVYVNDVAADFLNLYEIPIIQGQDFSPDLGDEKYVLINQAAAQSMGVEDLTGKIVGHGWPSKEKYTVLGVMENFHFSELNQKIEPACFFLSKKGGNHFTIKFVNGKFDKTKVILESVMEKYSPKYSYEYSLIEDTISERYTEERRLSRLFTFFTILAVFIACLGLFGLVSFVIDQRTKEIGIRKILGASIQSIITLLSRNIVMWVLLANILAWPVAWYFMDRWLQNFAYSTKLDIWTFLTAGFLTLIIALLTTGFQSVRSALMNPIETLKYE